jgi:RNA polymerase sigma-70 factor (ECF subfamily)
MAMTMERTDRAFAELAEPFRRELKVHCYRMLGGLHDAEDAVQDAYLRAWRGFDRFDGHGTFRAWLYRIATNVCLDRLASRKHGRRFLPDEYGPATTGGGMPDGQPVTDVDWLEPFPDSELHDLADAAPSAEARYSAREAVQLAFVAVIQRLPPRQRAVLLLCDVLGWRPAEAATLLGGSQASINSVLQRARRTLSRYRSQPSGPPSDAGEKALLGRYVQAWESLDLDGFVALLKEDAVYTMPPLAQWYAGRAAIGGFFGAAFRLYGGFRLLPIAANRQPAFAAYSRSGREGPWTAHSLHVLELEEGGLARLTLFAKPTGPALFESFKMPLARAD